MGAKQSEEARFFLRLLYQGWKLDDAAKGAGISRSSAYRLKALSENAANPPKDVGEGPDLSDKTI